MKHLVHSAPHFLKFADSIQAVLPHLVKAIRKDLDVQDVFYPIVQKLEDALKRDLSSASKKTPVEVIGDTQEGSHDLYGSFTLIMGDRELGIGYSVDGNYGGSLSFHIDVVVNRSGREKSTYSKETGNAKEVVPIMKEFLKLFDAYGFNMKA